MTSNDDTSHDFLAALRPYYGLPRLYQRGHPAGIAESMRAALASYAADSPDLLFPAKQGINSYTTCRAVVNANGGLLPATEATAHMEFVSYDVQDTDGEGTPDTYAITHKNRSFPSPNW